MDIHGDLVYSQTGYDVISYFISAFLYVRKTADNGVKFLWRGEIGIV